jgi:GNAT superfamily N-acetyltransferase
VQRIERREVRVNRSHPVESEVDIRRARSDEGPALAALYLRSRRASIPAIPPPIHTDPEVEEWFATVVLPQREVWVVEHADGLIALLVLEPDWLSDLYVDPRHTGRGVGSALVVLAKERSPGGLLLWAFGSNSGARRFYERHGFVAVGGSDGDNEEGMPDIKYHWSPSR